MADGQGKKIDHFINMRPDEVSAENPAAAFVDGQTRFGANLFTLRAT